jgi:hypothetical protein
LRRQRNHILRTILVGAISLNAFSPLVAAATADYEAVNHITREYTVLDDGMFYTPIGWQAVGENNHGYVVGLGYQYTAFPYKLECILIALPALLAVVVGLFVHRRRSVLKD